ncbi:hypothetical protein CEXT_681861 [Caerostris extrusa]|uniref:Uncharacterized protein n=1 Tax=Caerostris extrusa TaxID=172846 RepID=A0AAV4XKM1_CAEEX|nr:hypothetical protein CEXT_681861 [Caerostris extrusa]
MAADWHSLRSAVHVTSILEQVTIVSVCGVRISDPLSVIVVQSHKAIIPGVMVWGYYFLPAGRPTSYAKTTSENLPEISEKERLLGNQLHEINSKAKISQVESINPHSKAKIPHGHSSNDRPQPMNSPYHGNFNQDYPDNEEEGGNYQMFNPQYGGMEDMNGNNKLIETPQMTYIHIDQAHLNGNEQNIPPIYSNGQYSNDENLPQGNMPELAAAIHEIHENKQKIQEINSKIGNREISRQTLSKNF